MEVPQEWRGFIEVVGNLIGVILGILIFIVFRKKPEKGSTIGRCRMDRIIEIAKATGKISEWPERYKIELTVYDKKRNINHTSTIDVPKFPLRNKEPYRDMKARRNVLFENAFNEVQRALLIYINNYEDEFNYDVMEI